jgi:hypothetical protein
MDGVAMTHIVCYTGGTCGDLISAMIDSTDVSIVNNAIMHAPLRQRLKKPHLFDNQNDKDEYLQSVSKIYKSIPSHDVDYHVQRQHKFIAITVEDFSVAMWAAERFKKLHRPAVWIEMQQVCGADTLERYAQVMIDYSNIVKQHTNQIVQLERILNGHAVTDVSQYVHTQIDSTIYNTWLQCQ